MEAFLGIVQQTKGRNVQCKSKILGNNQDWIIPWMWADQMKFPVPQNGDAVIIFILDDQNSMKFYLPAPKHDSSNDDPSSQDSSSDASKFQFKQDLELTGNQTISQNLEVDGNTTLGGSSDEVTEPGVLGNQLKTLLQSWLTADLAQTHTTAMRTNRSPN